MTSSQKDASCGTSFPNDMARCGCGEDAILSDQELLDAVSCTNLGYQLHDLWIVVSSISANDQEAVFDTFGYRKQDAGDKRLAVMGLLEDLDLLSKP